METIRFLDFIIENLDIVDGKLVFDADTDTSIQTAFGKGKKLQPFKKKVPGTEMTSLSLYQSKQATNVLKALKSADYRDPEVKQFINRSAVYATRILRQMNIDIIVTPVSSSDLVKIFSKEIQKRTYYDFYIDSFGKAPDISKITVDKDDPRITDDIIASMEKTLARAKKKGFISVKQFAPPHRKFLKNLFEIIDESLYNKIADKNVVIIDDVMTSGTTAKQIHDVLKSHGANEITTLTMFKATS